MLATYPFEILIGEQLSALTFVMDYLQLHFDGPLFTVFKWPEITLYGSVYRMGDIQYRDFLCHFIGKKVNDVSINDDRQIDLYFESCSRITIFMTQPEDLLPESVVFDYGPTLSKVWVS